MWSPQMGHSRVSARLAIPRSAVARTGFGVISASGAGGYKRRTSLDIRHAGRKRGCRRNNTVRIRVAFNLRLSS